MSNHYICFHGEIIKKRNISARNRHLISTDLLFHIGMLTCIATEKVLFSSKKC